MSTTAERFASAQEMVNNLHQTYGAPDGQTYLTGDSSYLANAQHQSFNLMSEAFPPGWGQPGETPEGTVERNAIEGLWLPLFLPDGADGATPGQPVGFFYVDTNVNVVSGRLDSHGAAHSSEEVDDIRWHEAVSMGLNAATYSGSEAPGVEPRQ